MHEFLLGIDFGSKRIGLALGQTLTNTASALKVVQNKKGIWQDLDEVFEQWQIQTVVFGLPIDMDGKEQEITRQTKNFAKKVKHKYNVTIEFHDERLTSYEAERLFQSQRENKRAKAKEKNKLDAIAAQIILQAWLDLNQSN